MKKPRVACVGFYPPMFAGVNAVSMRETDDEELEWCIPEEEDSSWDKEVEDVGVGEDSEFSGEKPPEIAEGELEQLDMDAARAEVNKLKSMEVVREVERSQVDSTGKYISLKEVYDWRFRENRWIRRCRIVAREFKTSASSHETFSPTSCHSIVRMMISLHLCLGWKVMVMDIKDAFLNAYQQELCYVEVRPWMRNILQMAESTVWQLLRCLPGQRNAALRWFEHFSAILVKIGFKSCDYMPSLFLHETKPLVVSVAGFRAEETFYHTGRRTISCW